jgi:capsular exopolysaccharide synthesis family protein
VKLQEKKTMSRIQQILDKAEREGTVRRVHTETAVDTLAPTALFAAPVPAVAAVAAPPIEPHANGSAVPVTLDVEQPQTVSAARIVVGAHLDPRLITSSSTATASTEQYRALRTRILHADPASPASVVLISSPSRGEGKTLTTGNLGLAMAQEWQRRVCVVDADLRHPQMHGIFGLPDGPGLCDVLAGDATLAEALVTLEEHQLTILPAGHVPSRPAELLGTSAMRRTLEALRAQFDRVVIDAPPATPLADVSILAPMVDRVLLVVRAGVTMKPAIHDAVSSIEPSKLIGLVLNEAA